MGFLKERERVRGNPGSKLSKGNEQRKHKKNGQIAPNFGGRIGLPRGGGGKKHKKKKRR